MFGKLTDQLGSAMAKIGLAEAVEAPQTPAPGAATAQTPATVVTNFPPVPAVPSVDAERIAKCDASAATILQEAVAAVTVKHIPELQSFLQTLEGVVPVEALRYQTALKLFIGKGIPLVALINEYDAFEGALQAKEQLFAKESKEQYTSRVGAKVQAVEALNAQIASTQAQIASLQEGLVSLTAKRDTEQSGISVEETKMKTFQERFAIQYSRMLKAVQDQKQKIVEFGKGL